jgi:hypothetical protein
VLGDASMVAPLTEIARANGGDPRVKDFLLEIINGPR